MVADVEAGHAVLALLHSLDRSLQIIIIRSRLFSDWLILGLVTSDWLTCALDLVSQILTVVSTLPLITRLLSSLNETQLTAA